MSTPPQTKKTQNIKNNQELFAESDIELLEIDIREEISVENNVNSSKENNVKVFKKSHYYLKNTLTTLLIIITILTLLIFSEQAIFASKILPGIKIGNTNYGTKTKISSRNQLDKATKKYLESPIQFQVDGKTISISSQDFDLTFENTKTINKAYNFQKTYSPIPSTQSFFSRHTGNSNVIPVFNYNKDKFGELVQNISNELSSGRVDAGIMIKGLNVKVQKPVSGIGISASEISKEILNSVKNLSTKKIELKKKKVDAKITLKEANSKAIIIKEIFSKNSTITTPAGNIVTITPEKIAASLTVIPNKNKLDININETILRSLLSEQLAGVELAPIDATFAVNGTSVSVVGSQTGKKIDLETSIKSIIKGNHNIKVSIIENVPLHDTQWAKNLNITELVSTFTTNFTPGQIRVKNIARAAQVVNNTVIEPGKTFSLNQTLGKRTAENGYFKAPVYSGDDGFTEDFGGGASQFSTTMFNAGWIAGYKDIQHVPHSIYISRYPMGREATLNYGTIDLRIQDDYKSGILVRTYVGNSSVTVSLYGNKEGRVVNLEGPNIVAQTEIATQYTDDPTLPAGKEIQIDKGYPGITVENIRTIIRPGLPDKIDKLRWTYTMLPNKVRRGTQAIAPVT